MKSTEIVGSSTAMPSRRSGCSTSVTVSPISTPSSPASATISPAGALSQLDALESLEREQLRDARLLHPLIGIERQQRDDFADARRAALDAADAQAPEVRRVVDRRDEHLKVARLVARRRRDLGDDRLEERREVLQRLVEIERRRAVARRRVDDGASSCASSASSSMNRSSTSSWTRIGSAPGRSILLMTTIGVRPRASALRSTKRVCGIGPSKASTTSSTPSTMRRMRSTSPPKSAWPGVSTMLILVPCQRTDVFFARIVMPRSRSRGLESITRSWTI